MATWNDKPLLVPKTVPGDQVRVHIESLIEGRYSGRVAEVLSPGPTRRTGPCPHEAECGGCSLQHLTPETYITFKQTTLSEAVRKAGFDVGALSLHVEFIPPATRRRVEFSITHDDSGIASLAYAMPRSHQLHPITQCLLLAPALQQWVANNAPVLALCSALPIIEKIHLTLAAGDHIDMLLQASRRLKPEELEKLNQAAPTLGAARISVKGGTRAASMVFQEQSMLVRLGQYNVPLPAGAFLQASEQAQDYIANILKESVPTHTVLLDLFAGLGSWTFTLAGQCKEILAVEGEASYMQALARASGQQGLKHIRHLTRDLFQQPMRKEELNRFDAVLLNPPRTGAKAQAEQLTASKVKNVIMVSCNPATFTRDARILQQAGFRLTRAVGVDQFTWSAHLEIVAIFAR